MYTTDTKKKILQFIQQNGKASLLQLQEIVNVTSNGLYKHLKELQNSNKIIKDKEEYRLTNLSPSAPIESYKTPLNTPLEIAKTTLKTPDIDIKIDALTKRLEETLAKVEALSAELTMLKSNDHVTIGIEYYKIYETEKAAAEFNQAINIDPNNARAYMWRGLACYIGDGEEISVKHKTLVINDLNKSIELKCTDYRAFQYLSFSYFDLKDYDKSWEYYYKAIEHGWYKYDNYLQDLQEATGREK